MGCSNPHPHCQVGNGHMLVKPFSVSAKMT